MARCAKASMPPPATRGSRRTMRGSSRPGKTHEGGALMPLVYCGACSHAPGITARAERAATQTRQALHGALHRMGDEIRATRPDALVVVAAEHFANFFMNNMPAFAIGMADSYEGPIEDEAFLRIRRATVPGNKALSRKLIEG